ncbi:unnamed protein product [Trichobilharzia regenti]|nr:unnamed protein product [Trichobilharzia regenti]
MSLRCSKSSSFVFDDSSCNNLELIHFRLTDSALKDIEQLASNPVLFDIRNSTQCLGKMSSRITVNAKEDSFSAAKERMTQLEDENKKSQTKELGSSKTLAQRTSVSQSSNKRSSPCVNMKGKGNEFPSQNADVPNLNRVQSQNPAGCGPSPPLANPEVSVRSLRERIIHILALRPYQRPELLLRLSRDGLSRTQKDQISDILSAVGRVGRQSAYYLLPSTNQLSQTSPKSPADRSRTASPDNSSTPSSLRVSDDQFTRRPTRANAPSAPHALSKKIAALDMLCAGVSDVEVAARLGVFRGLLDQWRANESELRERYRRLNANSDSAPSTQISNSTQNSQANDKSLDVPNTSSGSTDLQQMELSYPTSDKSISRCVMHSFSNRSHDENSQSGTISPPLHDNLHTLDTYNRSSQPCTYNTAGGSEGESAEHTPFSNSSTGSSGYGGSNNGLTASSGIVNNSINNNNSDIRRGGLIEPMSHDRPTSRGHLTASSVHHSEFLSSRLRVEDQLTNEPVLSNVISTPAYFWNNCSSQPSPHYWEQWKLSFLSYLNSLITSTSDGGLSECTKLKLLRYYLGGEGRRYFDNQSLSLSLSNLQDAFNVLDKLWGVSKNIYASRLNFSLLMQEQGEQVDVYISRLLNGVKSCDYNNIPRKKIEDVMLIQQLIIGIKDDNIRDSLLTLDVDQLTWEKACEIAGIDAENLHRYGDTEKSETTAYSKFRKYQISCFRCGSTEHKANYPACPAHLATCYNCGKLGHYASCCRSSKRHLVPAVVVVQECKAQECKSIFSIGTESSKHMPKPIYHQSLDTPHEPKLPLPDVRTVYFLVDGRKLPVEMELDSASPVTIIPNSFYEAHLSSMPIYPTSYTFGSYSNDYITMRGYFMCTLCVEENSAEVAVYVALGKNNNDASKPLLGRNAMHAYQNLYRKDVGRLPPGIEYRIILQQNTIPCKVRQCYPAAKKKLVSLALQQMLNDDLIEHVSNSDWIHPMIDIIQKKRNGQLRLVCDLHGLNRQVIAEDFHYPPSLNELTKKLTGSRVFSKLHLAEAFYHMPLSVDSRPLTAFLTTDGLFQYKVLPNRFISAPGVWQKYILSALNDLSQIIIYYNEICIYVNNNNKLDENNELSYSKLIVNTNKPRNLSEVKCFLGLCYYYYYHSNANFDCRSDCIELIKPLINIIKSKESFHWTAEYDNAIDKIRQYINCTIPLRMINDFNGTTNLYMSIGQSNYGLSAVLYQLDSSNRIGKIIKYAFRKLLSIEKTFSPDERQIWTLLWACKHWHNYLYGRRFILRVNSKVFLNNNNISSSSNCNYLLLCDADEMCKNVYKLVRLNYWYIKLLKYTFTIQCIANYRDPIANSLSCLPGNYLCTTPTSPTTTSTDNQEEDDSQSIGDVNIDGYDIDDYKALAKYLKNTILYGWCTPELINIQSNIPTVNTAACGKTQQILSQNVVETDYQTDDLSSKLAEIDRYVVVCFFLSSNYVSFQCILCWLVTF